MSVPHRPPLAKPPPKALPPGRPPAAAAVAQGPVAPMHPAPIAAASVAAAPAPAPAPVLAAAAPSLPSVPQYPQMPPPPPVAAEPRPALPPITMTGLPPAMVAMVEAIRIYEELLVDENAMLRAGDANGVTALLDRKMHATRLYQERQRAVLGDPDATRALSPEQRTQVVTLVRSLEDLAKENTVLLKANMSAIEQLFEVINNATKKMRKREVAYSQSGVIRDYNHAQSSSLAYNHTV